jgi:hypothetical protein
MFRYFIKGSSSKSKEVVSRFVIIGLHTTKIMSQKLKDQRSPKKSCRM